jgi:radical SAM superfamily enzyme YgiQ (UPF0313 family)
MGITVTGWPLAPEKEMMTTSEFRVLLVYPNLMFQTMFPMGLALLSSVLKGAGYKVDSFDTTFYRTDIKAPHEYQIENLQMKPLGESFERALRQVERPAEAMIPDFRAKVESFQPDLIAVSAVEDTFRLAVDLLDGVSDLGIPNIIGGVFPTFAPEKAIREKNVNMICVGEGEYALLELCEALSKGRDHSNVRNLWVKKRNGDVVRNAIRGTVSLDELPRPDYALFDNSRFYFTTKSQGRLLNSGSVETARGCPYRCSFCNSPSQVDLYNSTNAGYFFRLKSVQRVYEELKDLKENHNVDYIHFPADTFLAIPDAYLHELAEAYKSINLPFWCQTRSETLTEERVRILEDMGCQNVSVGLEHGNEDFRRRVVRRDYTNKDFVEKFKLLEGASFNITVNNIIGLPMEDRKLTWDTIYLDRKVQHVLHTINAFHFVPYHGTPLRDVAVKEGFISDNSRVEHNLKDTIINMPRYTRDEIRGAVRTFTMYVRFPESEFPRIQQAERMDERGDAVFRELQQEFVDKYFKGNPIEIPSTT